MDSLASALPDCRARRGTLIAAATAEDLPAMAEVYRNEAIASIEQIWRHRPEVCALARSYFDRRAENLPMSLADPGQRHWVAREGGTVIAMGSFAVEPRLIHSVYVARGFRGSGVGTQLMRAMLSEFGDQDTYIYVLVGNDGAIRFYQRLGYANTGGDERWELAANVSITEHVMCRPRNLAVTLPNVSDT